MNGHVNVTSGTRDSHERTSLRDGMHAHFLKSALKCGPHRMWWSRGMGMPRPSLLNVCSCIVGRALPIILCQRCIGCTCSAGDGWNSLLGLLFEQGDDCSLRRLHGLQEPRHPNHCSGSRANPRAQHFLCRRALKIIPRCPGYPRPPRARAARQL